MKGCFIAWATDDATRKRGSSGGFVSAALAAALESNLVENVLTLKKISPYKATPMVTNDPKEVLECAGSLHFVAVNLAKYVPPGRVALPAKPCDAMGIIERAKRGQFDINDVYMLGLNCGGSIHPKNAKKMVEEMYTLDPDAVIGEEILKGQLILKTADGEKALKIDDLEEKGYGRRESCRYCATNIPRMADLACGNWGLHADKMGKATFVEVITAKGEEIFQNAIDTAYIEFEQASDKAIELRDKIDKVMKDLAEKWHKRLFEPIDELSDPERLAFYVDALSSCIGCGACRKVCPVCTCGDSAKCLTEGDSNYKIPLLIMVRLLHLMDSCIGCGRCEDVCPVGIPLTLIHRRFAERMQNKLGYVPGFNLDKPPYFEAELREDS